MQNLNPAIQILEALRNARDYFDQPNVIYSSKKNEFKDPETGFVFTSTDDLLNSLHELGIQGKTLKEAGFELEQWYELLKEQQETITEAPRPEGQTATTLTSNQLENLEGDVERIKESEKIRADQKVETARFEKRNKEIYAEQQRIQAAIKNKSVIVVPVTELPKATLNDNDKQTIVTFSNTAREDPYTLEQFVESKIKESLATATEEYKENITPSTITKSATSITENFAALTYENISEVPNEVTIMNPSSPFIPLTTYDNEKLKEIIPDEEVRIRFSEKTQSLAVGINAKANMDFSATKTLFGENIASVFYGPIDGHVTQFEIAKNQEEQKDEGIQFSLEDVYKTGEEFYNFYQKVKTAKTVEEVTSSAIIYTPTYTRATSAVVAAKTASTLAKALPYVGAYSGLRLTAPLLMNPNIAGYLGTGATQQMVILSSPVVSRNAFMFVSKGGKTALAIGTEKTVAGKTIFRVGVKFGQSSIATATTTAGTQVVTATGFFAKVVTFLGGLSTPVTAGIGLVVGYLAGKVIEKLPQIKKWFQENGPVLAGVAGLGGLALGGPAVGGLVLFGGLAATETLGTFALGTFGLLSFIGRSIGVAIATPVIVTLLVLPPLVAFIMLVINNSAYVVPPGPPSSESGLGSEGLPGVACTEEKLPTSITFSVDSPIANRAWEIVEDLYQGFWCSWNRSPGDLDTDITTYPDSYPELFNMDEYRKNPNPTRGEASLCGECMFWCTWLVQKAYKESGYDLQYTLWSPAMYDDFNSRGKILDERDMTKDNIQMGAVIFFDVKNSENRIDHVAIVYSVSSAGVKFVQSNSGTKDDFIPFGTDGILQNPSYATIKGVGNP